MELNVDIVKGKWNEIKGEIQKAWGDLTGDEIEKTKGDVKSIEGLIQQRYGAFKETQRDQLNGIFSKFMEKKDEALDATKEKLRNS